MSEGDVQTEMVKTAPKPRVSHFNPSAVVPMEETKSESWWKLIGEIWPTFENMKLFFSGCFTLLFWAWWLWGL